MALMTDDSSRTRMFLFQGTVTDDQVTINTDVTARAVRLGRGVRERHPGCPLHRK